MTLIQKEGPAPALGQGRPAWCVTVSVIVTAEFPTLTFNNQWKQLT